MTYRSLALFACLLSAAKAETITFHKQVEPILQANCQECHRAGEAAPMSFMTFRETRPWAASIREAVRLKKMPPWFADPAHGEFQNDRRLSAANIETLATWAATGAKEGNPADAPKPRTFTAGWTIGKPDAIFEMPTAYSVPAQGTIEYQYIVVPSGFTEDKWVSQVEVRPGDRSVVHHVVLVARPPGSKYMEEARPGIAFAPPAKTNRKHREDTSAGKFTGLDESLEMIGVYVPGGLAYRTAPGQARLVKAGSDFIFQMHYTANGKAALDKSQLGIIFAKEPPRQRVVNAFLANYNLHIPPGDPSREVVARIDLQEDVTLLSLFPHTHVRGKAFEYRAIYPTGEKQVLLSVPKYDFNWQLTYDLKKPLLLPKGTHLECVAIYDNSPNNVFNPDPTKDVYWGDQTWEEMLAGFMDFAIPVNMSPADIARDKKQIATK